MKKGGTGLHKTIREINLVYKGLMEVLQYHTLNTVMQLKLERE